MAPSTDIGTLLSNYSCQRDLTPHPPSGALRVHRTFPFAPLPPPVQFCPPLRGSGHPLLPVLSEPRHPPFSPGPATLLISHAPPSQRSVKARVSRDFHRSFREAEGGLGPSRAFAGGAQEVGPVTGCRWAPLRSLPRGLTAPWDAAAAAHPQGTPLLSGFGMTPKPSSLSPSAPGVCPSTPAASQLYRDVPLPRSPGRGP